LAWNAPGVNEVDNELAVIYDFWRRIITWMKSSTGNRAAFFCPT
jgi:hypothetical protein